MKLSCALIQDLLPLYADDACSPDSRTAVEEHLTECAACSRYLQTIRQPNILAGPEDESEAVVRERVMKNGFRKLRRRWVLSVLSVFLLFPLLLLGIMEVNEYRGEGLAFTNLDDIFVSQRFMNLIEKQEFEKAAELLDYEGKYQEIQAVLSWQPEDYLPSFELFTVDGESWIVKKYFDEQCNLRDLFENEDSTQGWCYLALNKINGIMIPESAWVKITQFLGDSMEYIEIQGSYFPIDTPWGRFYVECQDRLDLTEESELTAERLCQRMNLIPSEIYLEARESLEQQALDHYRWNQEYYAFAADMTQEEYVRNMRHKFIQALETCYSDGVTIQNPHFTGAYRVGQPWVIEISATLRYSTGQSFLITYGFTVQNGKLHSSGGYYPIGSESTDDPILKALLLSVP